VSFRLDFAASRALSLVPGLFSLRFARFRGASRCRYL